MNTAEENLTVIATIEQRLTDAFKPSVLEIIDDSDAHIGHSGAINGGGHFILKIRSQKFNQLSRLETHRLIYAELNDLIPHQIHAISINTH